MVILGQSIQPDKPAPWPSTPVTPASSTAAEAEAAAIRQKAAAAEAPLMSPAGWFTLGALAVGALAGSVWAVRLVRRA